MSQTKTQSAIEQIINIGSGFIVAMFVFQLIIIPVWDLEIGVSDNFWITCIYTVTSFVRSYFWRRFFNWWTHRGGKEKVYTFLNYF